MKNFFSSFLGALVAVLVVFVISLLIVLGIAGGIRSAFENESDKPLHVKANSVLMIDFNSRITERTIDNPFAGFSFGSFGEEPGIGLNDIVNNLRKAKADSSIKGIYLNFSNVPAGMASTEEIRNALLDFKTSKKFVYAYSETYDQKSYYLASVADKIFLNPQGGMELKGLSAQIMFYKKALDNLNVDVQIFRHGKFKSAIEPFMLDKMSEANRLQTEVFLGAIWNNILEGISKQRGMSVSELNAMADELKVKDPKSAVELKLVDELKYEDEVVALLKEKTGIKEKDKLNSVKIADYTRAPEKKKDESGKKEKIAVIYAVGSIESGKGNEETIGSDRIAKAIRDARLDTTIKAIVLRVNSPGGSALASDVIWREVTLAKKVKPFVVSMGDVAASGGYYISCAADKIYAQPNTITGSIGVFGIVPNAQKLFAEKLGINIDTVNTNKHSDVGTLYRGVTEQERAYIQKGVEDVYDVFTSRVAAGRKMSQADVDSIGQGRVWSGTDALRIKLVDELGGLDKAVAYAAEKSGVKNYKIVSLPKQKDPLSAFLDKKTEEEESRIMTKTLGEQYKYLLHLKSLLTMKGVQARMPFDLVIY